MNITLITLVELREECGGCPTKYSGKTINGNYFEAYFRHGHMSISLDDKTIFSMEGIDLNGADGVCSFSDFKHQAYLKKIIIKDDNATYSSQLEDNEKFFQTLFNK